LSHSVYIANFGENNSLWPTAKANDVVLTIGFISLHPFWKAEDREGYIVAAMDREKTVLGKPPSRQTAGRWYNLMAEIRDTENDIWISKQGNSLWWTVSLAGDLRETVRPSLNPSRHGPEVWNLEKPCRPWSDADKKGKPLRWDALHPKARDFLATEATLQKIANDRGYADYARALVNGDPLDGWHDKPLFSEKVKNSSRKQGRIFSPREKAAARMCETLLNTVMQANGQTIERQVKEKTTNMTKEEWEIFLLKKMEEQDSICALTGLQLGYDGECDDKEMWASLDRIDSNGHYTPDNVQIVCRFINRWKGADNDSLVRRLLGDLQSRSLMC
jgi:hypothetical protein